MLLLKEFLLNDKCSYLDGLEQTTHCKIINECPTELNQNLIERGYRRFGEIFFRPICPDCSECKSIKIDVENFKFSKSKRRVLNKAQDISIISQKPSISKNHLQLFEKYHEHMRKKKNWIHSKTSIGNYYNSFVVGHARFGKEILYFDKEKLIGVDLIDILDNGISSIYFYYDPDYAHLSLGKLSIYNQIIMAKDSDKKWIYLGYYVKNCSGLSYKAEYKPFKTLNGRPNEHEKYFWE